MKGYTKLLEYYYNIGKRGVNGLKSFGWLILVALVLGIITGFMNWPIWIAWGVIALLGAVSIAKLLHTVYYSKNLETITKFIDSYKKNPVYYYMYLQREGTPQEMEATLNEVLTKYKNVKYQAVYGVHRALLREDFQEAREYIEPMRHNEVGQYTYELIEIMDGKGLDEQSKVYQRLWMNYSIEAHRAYMKKDYEAFEAATRLSLRNSAGIQYYGNYYAFKKMREQLERKLGI